MKKTMKKWTIGENSHTVDPVDQAKMPGWELAVGRERNVILLELWLNYFVISMWGLKKGDIIQLSKIEAGN